MSQTHKEEHHVSSSGESLQTALLVEKAIAGNQFAFEQLVNLFQKDIFRMVYYRIRSTVDAEDLTQEIFLQAFKNLNRLRAVDRFKSWLYSIAINRVRDFGRKKRFQRLFSAPDDRNREKHSELVAEDGSNSLDNIIRKDFWKQVDSLLGKLPRMEKEVFILRFMDHLSIKEISLSLSKSESTVKTHLYRALRRFRKESSLLQFLKEDAT